MLPPTTLHTSITTSFETTPTSTSTSTKTMPGGKRKQRGSPSRAAKKASPAKRAAKKTSPAKRLKKAARSRPSRLHPSPSSNSHNLDASLKDDGTPVAKVVVKTVETPASARKSPPELIARTNNTGNFTRPSEELTQIHRDAFMDAVRDLDSKKANNSQMISDTKRDHIKTVLLRHKDGETIAQIKKDDNSAHHWIKKYALVSFHAEGMDEPALTVVKNEPDKALDQMLQICTYQNLYDACNQEHRTDHTKGEGLYRRVKQKWANIPRAYCKLFSDTCPICLEKGQKLKKPTSGSYPILTPGFGKRGQIDLVDMQSCPDGEFKYILNYYDHGTKMGWSQAIINQRASSVARALIDVFTIYGPPAILQPDNAKNMSKIATFPKARKVELDEHYMSNVIKHVKHL